MDTANSHFERISFSKSAWLTFCAAQTSVMMPPAAILTVAALFGAFANVEEFAGLFLYILLVSAPVVNAVGFLVFLPLFAANLIDLAPGKFILSGATAGGSIHVLLWVVPELIQGMHPISDFYSIGSYFPTFLIGAIYGVLFCMCFALLYNRFGRTRVDAEVLRSEEL